MVGVYERQLIEEKMMKKDSFFPDELLEKHTTFTPLDPYYGCVVDMPAYKKEYYETNFPTVLTDKQTVKKQAKNVEKLSHAYLEGMQWVLTYYTRGIATNGWRWSFGHSYSPFASDIAKAVMNYEQPSYPIKGNGPFLQFQQLLAVLPPSSAGLLPECLGDLIINSELADFCPAEIEVDLSGKKNDYEGVVLLPMVDMEVVKRLYDENIGNVDAEEALRNKRGLNRLYRYDRVKQTVGVEAIEF
jgi:5'-3' exoribonuclease 1